MHTYHYITPLTNITHHATIYDSYGLLHASQIVRQNNKHNKKQIQVKSKLTLINSNNTIYDKSNSYNSPKSLDIDQLKKFDIT